MPEHLEAELIASIPARMPLPKTSVVSAGRRLWVTAILGVAATAAVLCVVFLPHRPSSQVASGRPLLQDTSPAYVIDPALNANELETDPCTILPPLPDWH